MFFRIEAVPNFFQLRENNVLDRRKNIVWKIMFRNSRVFFDLDFFGVEKVGNSLDAEEPNLSIYDIFTMIQHSKFSKTRFISKTVFTILEL